MTPKFFQQVSAANVRLKGTRTCNKQVTHLSHEEPAAVVEHLSVVRTLCQGVQPHADRLLWVSSADVEVGQSVAQGARLGTELQERLAQGDTVIVPAGTRRHHHHQGRN